MSGTYVGLDVQKATVSTALAEGDRGGELRQFGAFENRPVLYDGPGEGGPFPVKSVITE